MIYFLFLFKNPSVFYKKPEWAINLSRENSESSRDFLYVRSGYLYSPLGFFNAMKR